MGKRTSFERREADFYPTPFKAVPPLIPYLRRDDIKTFAELCCGEGDLIRHLESFGLKCVHSGDIRTGQDAWRSSVISAGLTPALLIRRSLIRTARSATPSCCVI